MVVSQYTCDDLYSGSEINSSNLLGNVSEMSLTQLEDLGVGLNVGIAWEEALHSALMPITPQASMGSLAESKSSAEREKERETGKGGGGGKRGREREGERVRESCTCTCTSHNIYHRNMYM